MIRIRFERAIRLAVAFTAMVIVSLFCGADAQASSIVYRWETIALPNPGSPWVGDQLVPEGYGHFIVNGTGLPTRSVPGQFKAILVHYPSGGGGYITAYRNRFEAPLNAVLGIMRVGSNSVRFTYGNLVSRDVETFDNITAHGQPIGDLRLFRIAAGGDGNPANFGVYHWYGTDDLSPDSQGRVDGDEFDQSQLVANINLTLDQIDPQLVADIKKFEAAIQQDKAVLIANAAQVKDLAKQLADLAQLQSDLAQLLTQDLGEDLARALEALLSKYPEISPATRDALVKVITDLQKSIADMQAELDRITSDFAAQTAQVVGTVEHGANGAGWNGDDLSSYTTSIDPATIPGVTVPDTSGVNPFDPQHDAYAAYADQVLAKLGQYVQSNDVVDRQDFISIVRGWRDNQAALENALRQRGYPLQETNAFNAARTRVTDYLRRFIDGKDWFIDNPVPPETRAAIDNVLAQHWVGLARRLKDAMNELRGPQLTPDEALAVETVDGLAAGSDGIDPGDTDTESHVRSAIEGVIAGLQSGLRLGVGFIPVVGDAMDVCEAITGYENCTSTGKSLSVSDRILSGLGVIIGSGKVWQIAANGVHVASHAIVIARIGRVADHLGDLPVAERKALLARIGHIVEHLDDLPGKEIRRLTDKFGDLAVMQLAPKLKSDGLHALERMDFFLPRLNAQVQAAAKTRGAAVKALPPLQGKSLTEIRGILQQAEFAKDAGSTAAQEVWIHRPNSGGDGSVIRIALTGTAERPAPHLKKEISFNLGYQPSDIACKVTDSGMPVSQGNGEAREIMRQWFKSTVGEQPDATGGGALDLMVRIWGDATHIPFTP